MGKRIDKFRTSARDAVVGQQVGKRVEEVREHIKENRSVYISSGISLVAGLGMGLAMRNKTVAIQKAKNVGLIVWKPVQNLEQTTTLIRRGHPGFVIKCQETGEVFASKNRAAEVMGVNRANLNLHLQGKMPSVNGYHFVNLGEAA